MAVCPICGCKTQDIDFINRPFGDTNISVCSFCDKQLKKIEDNCYTVAEERWLSAVVAKEVPNRDEFLNEKLDKLNADLQKKSFGNNPLPKESKNEISTAPRINRNPVTFHESSEENSKTEIDKNYVIGLETRIKKLEAEIRRFKKMQLIKTILEIVIPVILAIIILIIFMSSGIMDYFGQLQDLTDMMSNSVTPIISENLGGII